MNFRFCSIFFLSLAVIPMAHAEDVKPVAGKFELVSSAFKNNEEISQKYTCHEGDVNPPLEFLNIPPKTRSLALTVQDLDAPEGTWVHWVVYNIPPSKTKIDSNSTPGYEALNDFGKYSYSGPCPANEKIHRYVFRAYALKDIIPVDEGMMIKDLEKTIAKHIIAKSELTGTYRKSVW